MENVRAELFTLNVDVVDEEPIMFAIRDVRLVAMVRRKLLEIILGEPKLSLDKEPSKHKILKILLFWLFFSSGSWRLAYALFRNMHCLLF